MDIDDYRRARAWEREEALWWALTFWLIRTAFRLLWWLLKVVVLIIVVLAQLVFEGVRKLMESLRRRRETVGPQEEGRWCSDDLRDRPPAV